MLRPTLDVSQTALHQVAALGYSPSDVRHIVLTHLDFDHAGGLRDFPNATVHTTAVEHQTILADPRRLRWRYRLEHLLHEPAVTAYGLETEPWRGFAAAFPVAGVGDEMALIPMPGHTNGHAIVAVMADELGMLVHAGDAAFDGSTIAARDGDGTELARSRGLRLAERLLAMDASLVAGNHATLRLIQARKEVTVFAAHDPRTTTALRSRAPHLFNP